MLSLIVAIAENNVIGKDNKLIWHISEDLKRFKSITSGNTMIMGRKTFESLPGVLPNRKHIIVTRDNKYTVDSDQVSVIHDLDSFIKAHEKSDEEIFVIGGAEIYKILAPYCNEFFITHIKDQVDSSDELIYLPKEARPDKSFSKNIILDNNNLTIIFYKR